MTEEKNKLEGLGGWLILVGVGVIASPMLIFNQLHELYSPFFDSGIWEKLTILGKETHIPLLIPMMIMELLISVTLVLWMVWLAFLFFTKSKAFPTHFIALRIFYIAFLVLDMFLGVIILPNVTMFGDSELMKQIFGAIVYALIWIPYMIRSKRVKATFIC